MVPTINVPPLAVALPILPLLALQKGIYTDDEQRFCRALHWAAAENHGEVVEALLDHGADVLLETRDGVTAGELAAIRKNRQIAEVLHDIEESELKVLAEGSTESSIAKSSQAEQLASVPVKVSEPEPKQEPVPVPEPVFEPQSRNESTVPQPLPELDSEPEFIETPVIARPFPAYERKFSQEEIEARKDEAREIVISAIDAALARNLGKLMGSAQLPEHDSSNTESELRSRRVPRDVADQLEGKSEEGDSDLTETMQAGEVGANAHNMVMSLAIAAALFFFFKLMWYFNSSS